MRRHEFFSIRHVRRTYDRRSGKFIINIAYETSAPSPSGRVISVAEGFGLGLDTGEKFVVYDDVQLRISDRDVVYITGDSGSGKSVLLKSLQKDIVDNGLTVMNIADVRPELDRPLVETVGRDVSEALRLLAAVGLGDAFLVLRTFDQLSDGQKYRYKIAKMMESKAQFWILDEFAAMLDRSTAKIVAFNLQRLARQQGRAVLAATTHTDLLEDLHPNVHVHKKFGKEIIVNYLSKEPTVECSLVREMSIEVGTTDDWKRLASFHYRSHRIVAPRRIFCLKRGEELCGVIVYCYPGPACFGRRLVLPRMSMRELNAKLSVISRIVVHPKYRTVGLGAKLVRETLSLAGTEYVEMSAVMAKYNPFAEKAGMRKVVEQPPSKEALKISEVLKRFGFNIQLLGSTKYVLTKLQILKERDILDVREAFIRNANLRFLKSFSCRLPFGPREAYSLEIEKASLDKLASLVKICGFLLQTKSYFFWMKDTSVLFQSHL